MNATCVYIPSAPNGKESILFKTLQTVTRNRAITKTIWAFTQSELFKSEFGDLAKDENGEPTYDALMEVLSLKELIEKSQTDKANAIKMGILHSNGNPMEFDNASTAFTKAIEFNSTAASQVAVINYTDDGKFKINIVERTPDNVEKAENDRSLWETNKRLIELLNKMGFDVSFANNPAYNGLFNPLEAKENAAKLKQIITVANSEAGLNSLPEETAHLILAGLKDNALKQRIDSQFNDERVRQVLGKDYAYYFKKYSKQSIPREQLLREEAEARVLADILKGNKNNSVSQTQKSIERVEANNNSTFLRDVYNLFARLWNTAKALFKKATTHDVDNAAINYDQGLYELAEMIDSGEVETVISKEQIAKHPPMESTNQKVNEMLYILQNGEALLAKRLYILQNSRGDTGNPQLFRKQVEELRADIEEEQYAQGCVRILSVIGLELQDLKNETAQYSFIRNSTTDLSMIDREAGLVNRISIAVSAYMPYIHTLKTLPRLVSEGKVSLNAEDLKMISDTAAQYQEQLEILQDDIRELRLSVLKQFVSLFYGNYGEKPETFKETEQNKWESVDLLLGRAKSDISWWDSNLFSAGDSMNPLLNVIHNIIVRQQAKRNNKINKLCARVQEFDRILKKEGYDNNFIYEYNEDGKPTGYYHAPVDMLKFERDRQFYIESVNANEDNDYYTIQKLIKEWDEEHTIEVEVGKPIGPFGVRRTERMPNPKYYKNENFKKGWTKPMDDYYEAVMDMKAEMDSYLPPAAQTLYLAPQVRKSLTQMFDKDGRGAWKTMMSHWKQRYTITDDNEDYGKNITVTGLDGKQVTLLDFEGKPIKRVPVYYVHMLENRADMSTDGTHAMMNYIAMAVNYSEMGELANCMRLMQDHVREDYEVMQTDAGKPMIDMFKAAGEQYEKEYVKIGEGTNIAKAIITYIDRTLFNDTKKKLGNVKNPFNETKPISKDSIFNVFLHLTSVSRMGLNVLSGITNITQGESQILTEAIAGRYFNIKDFGWSKKEYAKLLLDYMGQFNSADRHDKMFLLINQFNSGEDFFRDMKDRDFNKSAMKRVMGRGNIYFLNTMGEHMLHTTGMLMVLRHEKVTVKDEHGNKKEVPLYDVIKEVHDERNGWHLELSQEVTFEDGNKSFLTGYEKRNGKVTVDKISQDQLFENLSVYINNINAGMHGGYSEAEKGNMNQQALWRAILQFRQWMFGMFNKAYSGSYYDAVTQTVKEGGYISLGKFILGTLHDLKNMSIKAAIENNRLTSEERKNAAVALGQTALFALLAVLCKMTIGWKDEDDRYKRLLSYSMLRLKTETGAFVPGTPLVKNIFTLIQAPAAGINTLETVSQIFDLNNYWDEINSGRYKGWTVAEKAVWTISPMYNIQKMIDMKDYNYMFNIFN